ERTGLDRIPVERLDQAEGARHDDVGGAQLDQRRSDVPGLHHRLQLAGAGGALAHDLDAGLLGERLDVGLLDRVATRAARLEHAQFLGRAPRLGESGGRGKAHGHEAVAQGLPQNGSTHHCLLGLQRESAAGGRYAKLLGIRDGCPDRTLRDIAQAAMSQACSGDQASVTRCPARRGACSPLATATTGTPPSVRMCTRSTWPKETVSTTLAGTPAPLPGSASSTRSCSGRTTSQARPETSRSAVNGTGCPPASSMVADPGATSPSNTLAVPMNSATKR